MLDCTPSDSWQLALTYVLPPAGALLSATALWVASRARTTSTVALSTSRDHERPSDVGRVRRGDNGSPRAARDRRK
jgi:hypothetical protein